MEEAEIIEKLKKQDKLVQKYLYTKYKGLFFAICLRYAASYDEAQDILQESFMKIFTNITKYSGTGSFEGWMKKILINHSINYYRKSIKNRYFEDVDNIKNTPDDYKIDENDFTYEELLNTISSLPVGYRTIFNLYAIEGYKHKEIAELLNITENTSKSQYHRAKFFLQNKLELLKAKKNEQ